MIFGGHGNNEDGTHKPSTNAMNNYTIQNYFLT